MGSQDDELYKLDANMRAVAVVVRLRGIVAELLALRDFYDRNKLVDRVAEGPEDEIARAATILDEAADDIEERT